MPSYEQSTLNSRVGEVLAERRYSSSASSKKDSKWQLPRTPNAKAPLFLELQTAISAPDHPNGPLAFGTRATA